MARPNWLLLLRQRFPHLELFVLGGLIAFAYVALTLALTPSGPGEPLVGRVEGFGITETERGTFPVARVRLGTHRLVVRIPRGHGCQAGDEIRLQRIRLTWGAVVRAAANPCRSRPADQVDLEAWSGEALRQP